MYVYACSILFLFIVGMTPNLNVNVPGSSPTTPAGATLFGGAPNSTLGALVSQHRLLELSRFGLRGYDLAQHMLTQQGAVSKLLGKFIIYLQTRKLHKFVRFNSLINCCYHFQVKSQIYMQISFKFIFIMIP